MTYTVQQINKKAENPKKAVEKSEKYYNKNIEKLASSIVDDSEKRIVLLAGPSSSGKTTTAHLLCKSLKEKGLNPYVISLDNFYLPREKLPKLENGETDYESVHALDIKEVNNCLESLVKNGRADIPKYDFTVSDEMRKEKITVTLRDNDIVIIEGLHALNPLLHEKLSRSSVYKIYISLSSKIHGKHKDTLLSSRDLRLVRRLVRDYNYRNSPVVNTFEMWAGVLRGEEKFLYCYKRTADYKFDTFLSYEPTVLKDECLRLLMEVSPDSDYYGQAQKLIFGMSKFLSVDKSYIPKNSLLNEFVAKK